MVAYIYSAPPLKLKANGWTGTYALGASYIALPWWCGHAMFNAGSISSEEVILTVRLGSRGQKAIRGGGVEGERGGSQQQMGSSQ